MATAPARRPRADALRNRQRLIDAAAGAFAELGLDVSVAEIARRAGVGSGTLFRNFPAKDDLIHAVIEARVNELVEIGERAYGLGDPLKSLEQFFYEAGDFQARDRGFFEAIEGRVIDDPELLECKHGVLEIVTKILERAQKAGVIRKDIVAEDLRFLLISAVRSDPVLSNEPGLHRRYLRIILDGLNPQCASKLEVPPPKLS
ncbi:MAG TPA: TetR/AcrR family transcriptional regulator [Solirubrobacterales bacterium]|jgi:AcrR family transcriptional regulator|nr:TetR/AcrR family transcriptional regulator [Solirubrobacterales bacterium]